MYTKEDVVKFGTYLLSQERTKRVEFQYPQNDQFAARLREVTDDDFFGAFPEEPIILTAQDFVNNPELAENSVNALDEWPVEEHVLTQEDLDVNGPITDAVTGEQLVAGTVIGIPTIPVSELKN